MSARSLAQPTVPFARRVRRAPWLFLGLALVALFWSIAWAERTPLAHHTFFPLWLGYILTVDALCHLRTGSSLLSRSPARFAALFAASVPLWWLFEAFNARLQNWSYQLPRPYSWLAYHAEASLAFSTVVPAIFVTAELFRSFAWVDRHGGWIRLTPGRRGWMLFSAAGASTIAHVLLWPDLFFPLVWIGVFFMVDPIVHVLGGRSIATQVERGWWGTVWVLFAATLTCGFFWEMWNSRAMPKWTYDIPYADWLRVFEMPLLGYGGYLPFGLETYALVMLINRLTGFLPDGYLRFDAEPSRAAG